MKIDYFCFSVPSIDSTDYTIEITDDENIIWVKMKEIELLEKAKKHDMLILYDRTTKKFYKDGIEFDINGFNIFPRCSIPNQEELLTQIKNHQGNSITSMEEIERITNWPLFIQPIYRKVIVTTYDEFVKNHEKYKTVFHNLFFKTAKKSNNSKVLKNYQNVEFQDDKGNMASIFMTKPPLLNVRREDTVFLSEAFQSIEDTENDMDCKEYRVFVLNHNLLSISRSYVDYPTKVPDEVKIFAEKQIEKASLISKFPSSYVLDIGQMKIKDQEVIDIIEYNSICSSGLEICNLLVEELDKQNIKQKQLIKK